MRSPDDSSAPPPCYDCSQRADERLEEMFVDLVQKRRIALGQAPAMRPVFRKLHGVASARLDMAPQLPEDLRIGLFAGRSYPAWVRFSSDAAPADADLRTTLGLAIKLFGVGGEKGQGRTHDLLFQNHDVFFVDTAKDMCEFTYAGVVKGNYQPYLDTNPDTDRILKEMAKVEASVLTASYWGILPFRFGHDRYVKYSLVSEAPATRVPGDTSDYLAADLANRLRQGDHRFRLMLQFRTDPDNMPLDRATVRWSTEDSPPVHVATLVLPRQDVQARGQRAYGENLAFNIWHAPAEHEPVGSIAEARKRVYAASADTRRTANGTPLEEPNTPRPPVEGEGAAPEQDAGTDAEPSRASCIVRAVIHPSIGIARVGNSPEAWFIGPEVPEPPAPEPGSHRDERGLLKRQAARFRIYGLDSKGRIVRELTAAEATIRWTVHLANKKAAWYQFQLALDIPEASAAPPTLLRNAAIGDRAQLTIDQGPLSVEGRPEVAPTHFDAGRFLGREVYLGELRTDTHGRLIVLGGRGHSASHDGSRAVTFANNDGWYDDTSDGPVTAEVHYQGRRLDVVPSWVVVAPPNYAPMQKSVRTMWDLMRDVAIQAGMLAAPVRPSFARDIRPLFERLSDLQWVNAGFAAAFGWKGSFELASRSWLQRLSRPSPEDRELRHRIARQFRDLGRDSWSPTPWPWNYGDAMNVPAAQTPRQHAALTATQLRLLQQWADGDFEADDQPDRVPPRRLEDVPLAEQGDVLDRAALEFCLADAFHPGCEMTWTVRSPRMYLAPFRWKHAASTPEASYGASLIPDTLSLPDGPLAGQYPGGITRWMAVPWQTDTASCRSGYEKDYDPYLPTFWPARVPNQVLTHENYAKVVDPTLPPEERLRAFASRAAWTRAFDGDTYTQSINNLVAHIDWPGVVEPRPGPADGAPFPGVLQVEDRDHEAAVLQAQEQDAGSKDAARQAGRQQAPAGRASVGAARGTHATERVEKELQGIEKAKRFPQGLRRG